VGQLCWLAKESAHVRRLVLGFYAPNHGKGVCDASFGYLKLCLREASRVAPIREVADVAAAVERRRVRDDLWTPHRMRYKALLWGDAKPPTAPGFTLEDVELRRTWCLVAARRGSGWSMRNPVFLDLERSEDAAPFRCRRGASVALEPPAWRQGYYASKPWEAGAGGGEVDSAKRRAETSLRQVPQRGCLPSAVGSPLAPPAVGRPNRAAAPRLRGPSLPRGICLAQPSCRGPRMPSGKRKQGHARGRGA
jgi:hypothetical protein